MIPITTLVNVGVTNGAVAASSFVTFSYMLTGYEAAIPIEFLTPNSTISAGAEVRVHRRDPSGLGYYSEGILKKVFPLQAGADNIAYIYLDTGEYLISICSGGWQGTTNLTGSVAMGTSILVTAYVYV